ncbi:MAG TPA: MFS transporter [Candidatus Limnocylindrales bacterium]|nr:MFS transporter [Candidatus Limnocylindrales bacterium]
MFRPTFAPSASQREVGRNLAIDLVGAVGLGVTIALISALLPTIARRGGLEPLGLSALAAAPFVANFLGAFAGRVGPRSSRELAAIRAGGAGALILLVIAPLPAVMVIVAVLFWLSVSLTGPFQLRLWGTLYPSRLRGRVVGAIGMGRAAAGAVAAFAGGLIADRLGGPPAVAIAGVVGLACAIAYVGSRTPVADRPRGFSARESIRALHDRPVLARMALAQGFYGGGLIAAAPLYALVYVDRLDLSLADVGLIGILTAASTTIAFPLWGAVADRHGPLTVLRVGGSIGLCSLVAYAIAPHVAVLWVAALAAGTASASIDVGIAAVVSEQTPLADRAAAMAGWNAFTGARGIVAAFLMTSLLQLGVVGVTGGLLICAGATAIGVAMYARSKPGVPVESRAWELGPVRRTAPIRPTPS